jgi:hypothetical protein
MPSVASEQFNFSPQFQDLIIACLVKEQETFGFLALNLSPKHFSGLVATVVAGALLDYYHQYARMPSMPMLGELAREKATSIGMEQNEVDEYLKRVDDMDTADWKAVKEKLTKFVEERECVSTLKKAIVALQEGKPFDYVAEFTRALTVCKDMSELGLLFDPTDGEAVVRKVTASNYGVRCGYPLIDNIFYTGFAPGWLIVPLAPPKSCKTTLCLNFAYNIISPAVDEDCIYNTCEISEELAFLRELCRLIRLPIASVYQNPELFIQMMHTAFSRSNFRSKLLFKGWSAGQATISDFKTHAMVLKGQGLEPRAMIIDFAETVKPSKTEGEVLDRRQQANIYTDARALGSDVGLAVFMPDRCNVETVSRAVPNMTSFQGAFQKGGIVDVAFGICMTEIEKINNIFRLFFFLNRHGPSMQYFRGLLDLETYRMEVNEEIEYVPDEDDKVGKAHVRTKRGQQGHLPQELQE